MKPQTVLIFTVLLSCLSQNASADAFLHIQTSTKKVLGKLTLSQKEISLQTSADLNPDGTDGHAGSPNLPIRMSLSILGDVGPKISKIIAATSTYRNLVAYKVAVSGSDSFIAGAPLYGKVTAVAKLPTQVALAQSIFPANGSETYQVTLLEGTQDYFFFREEFNDCTLYKNSPLWILRLTNSKKQSMDFHYALEAGLITSVEVGKQFFPNVIAVITPEAKACNQRLQAILAAPGILN
jgi:hypothetical protein